MTKQNKFFNGLPIWFINLDSSEDRLNNIVNSFKEYGITEYRRIQAVDGKVQDLSVEKAEHHTKKLNSGEMAANLSYIKLINEFLNSEHEHIVMCDDDVDFKNSVHFNFNFYDTLEFHNPEKYSLKLTALDLGPWFAEQDDLPANKLIKPSSTSFGNATIINKPWAKKFLERYDVLDKDVDKIDRTLIYRYTQNINGLPSFVIPACDSLTFDEDTYVWRVFGVFDDFSTLNPETFSEEQHLDQKFKQLMAYNQKIDEYSWKMITVNDIFNTRMG